jgi:hypothetical protein
MIEKSPNLADGLHLRYSGGDIPIKGKGSMVTHFVERSSLRDNTPQEELRHDNQFFVYLLKR